MKKKRTGLQRAGTVMLAIWLCIAMMPLGAFAEDGLPAAESDVQLEMQEGESLDLTGLDEQAAEPQASEEAAAVEEEAAPEEDVEVLEPESALGEGETAADESQASEEEPQPEPTPAPATATKVKLGSNTLKFKKAVVKTVPKFMKEATIQHLWIKAAKKAIKLNWDLGKNFPIVDGVIILRKAGNEKVYSEVKRVSFYRNDEDGNTKWTAVKAAWDKKDGKVALKKNTPYTYVIVSYVSEEINDQEYVFISNCSEWAAGQTTASKLKNAYKATINKTKANLQYKGNVTLTLKHNKPAQIYNSKSVRWYSDDTSVAKVTSKGKVTATGVGATHIRGRLPSGYDVLCTVRVVGAFTPSVPTIRVDTATNSSISLLWTKSKYADSYDLYRSDDGLHWKNPINVKGTSYKVTGLTKGHRYSFYVVGHNDNHGYTAVSSNSNVIYQKAVIKRRATTLSGWPTSKSLTNGTTYSVTVKIGSPDGRKASLQMLSGKKWVTKRTISLPKGAGTASVKITFPNDWWGTTSEWRVVIPKSITSTAHATDTLTIKSARKYQNPSGYVQIADSISKHGYSYYVSKVLVNSNSTRSDHVEALIKTANKYKGDKYVNGRSGAPGSGIDASGLVIQACYGAGVDLWPISPSTRPANCVPRIMNSKLAARKYTKDHVNINRGDLIFFYTGKNLIGHVAIYLGYGNILHASMVTGVVETSTIDELIKPIKDGGKYGYEVAGCRRIFN